jgi:hypothetical protein
MEGIISIEPIDDGYDFTKNTENYVRAQDVDCNEDPNSSLCFGEKGRNGSILL